MGNTLQTLVCCARESHEPIHSHDFQPLALQALPDVPLSIRWSISDLFRSTSTSSTLPAGSDRYTSGVCSAGLASKNIGPAFGSAGIPTASAIRVAISV